jgi:hypothetical protein
MWLEIQCDLVVPIKQKKGIGPIQFINTLHKACAFIGGSTFWLASRQYG